jgi:hypothetical protein
MKGLALLLPVLVALQVGVQPALAWAWPVDGPVLRPFVLGDDPYAGGQHRGIDIGAPPDVSVRAPASGMVSFAGTVPSGGKTVTIHTDDGYAVTLLHLGVYSVARGDLVTEGGSVGSVGPSGDASESRPFVYLGVRVAADPNGYVDPLGLLPSPVAPGDPAPPPSPLAEAPSSAGGETAHASAPQPGSAASPRHARPTVHAGSHLTPRAPAHEATLARPRAHADQGRRIPVRESAPGFAVSASHAPPVGTGVVPGVVAGPKPERRASHGSALRAAWPLAAAMLAAAQVARLLARRRELGDAGPAHDTSAVLAPGAPAPAEDADRLRRGREDRVDLDGDLEARRSFECSVGLLVSFGSRRPRAPTGIPVPSRF